MNQRHLSRKNNPDRKVGVNFSIPAIPFVAALSLAAMLLTRPPLSFPGEPAQKTNANVLKREQITPLAPRPVISDVQHTILHYDKTTYCGHPREVLFQRFAGDELIVGHYHAPCRYEVYEDVRHICYQSRSVLLLQRSTDGGKTWPKQNDVVLFDQTMPPEKKRAFLFQENAEREKHDMFRPESVFLFARTYLPADQDKSPQTSLAPSGPLVGFSLRSPDKGYTWESVPALTPYPKDFKPAPQDWLWRPNTPVIRMPDGKTLLTDFPMHEEPSSNRAGSHAIFCSQDQGITWHFLSWPIVNRSVPGYFAYHTLLLLPNGELHCYSLHIARGDGAHVDETVDGIKNAICLSVSQDGGKTWCEQVPIVGKGGACWKNSTGNGNIYRSPYPILLKDGRILVLFARRHMPGGIGGILSSDGGKTWSEEFVLRDDAKLLDSGYPVSLKPDDGRIFLDLGYPVGCQLDDGRIFTAYYYRIPDGNKWGGTRCIVGTFFRIAGDAGAGIPPAEGEARQK